MVDIYQQREAVASHIPLLTRVFDLSEGDVLEVGTGYFSTLLLHWLATISHRQVYSYESKGYWYQRSKKFENGFHHIIYCPSWDEADFDKREWGLVFIDHSPDSRRPVEIERLANKTDYMVIHDTEPERDWKYGYSKIWSLFNYKHDYKKILPWTSVVSNMKDFSDII